MIYFFLFVAGWVVGFLTLATLYARQVRRGFVFMQQGKRHVWIPRDYVQGGIWDITGILNKKSK